MGWVSLPLFAVDISARLASAKATALALDRATVLAWVEDLARRGWPILKEISDPRGRCNRRAFLVIALVFLGLQALIGGLCWLTGTDLGFEATVLLNAPVLWIGTTVCFKRLHDIGLSAWWMPTVFAAWALATFITAFIAVTLLGEDAMTPGRLGFYVVFTVVTLPAFGALLWLHTSPSDVGANRFGPMPGETGLSMPGRSAQADDVGDVVAA